MDAIDARHIDNRYENMIEKIDEKEESKHYLSKITGCIYHEIGDRSSETEIKKKNKKKNRFRLACKARISIFKRLHELHVDLSARPHTFV